MELTLFRKDGPDTLKFSDEKPPMGYVPYYTLQLANGYIFYVMPNETPNWGDWGNVNICFTTEDRLSVEEGPACPVDGGYYHFQNMPNGSCSYKTVIPSQYASVMFSIPTYVFDKFTEVNYIR